MLINIARRDVITAPPDSNVKNLAGLMDYYNVGCVVIIDRDRPVGIVTDRDLVTRCLLRLGDGLDPDKVAASQVMTARPTTIHEEDSFDKALEVMLNAGVRRLPVVDRRGKLRGMVTLDDILEEVAGDMKVLEKLIQRQRKGPKRKPPARQPAASPRTGSRKPAEFGAGISIR